MRLFLFALVLMSVCAPALAGERIDLTVPENGAGRVYEIASTEEGVAFALSSGEDVNAFEMAGPAHIRFRTAPDFENPQDTDHDNVYRFTATRTQNGETTQVEVAIRVIDMPYCGLPDPNRAAAEVTTLPCRSEPVFFTRGADILDPKGKPFVARGINLQYGDTPALKFPSIRLISQTGSNMVRLQLRRNTTAEQVRAALDEAVALNLPVMVFHWEEDTTCRGDVEPLKQDVQALWLDRWLPVLSEPKYQPYLMVNIANEWGRSEDGFDSFIATYSGFIEALRLAGYRAPIVIDAGDCGQNPAFFLEGRGGQLVEADPLKNIIVSVHAYHHLWNTPAKTEHILSHLAREGVPFLLGEFGDAEFEAAEGMAVDHHALMRITHKQRIGWLVWSWKGNGSDTRILDMSESYDELILTRRGRDIVDGPYGLRHTSSPVRY